MAVTRDASAYAESIAALLPQGDAWPREPGTELAKLRHWMGTELAKVDARAANLLREADPRETLELLDEWEAEYGLPDECTPLTTFRRASEATWFDSAGVLRIAPVDFARPLLDPVTGLPTGGTQIENASANEVPNPLLLGAVAGTSGTLPTDWNTGGSSLSPMTRTLSLSTEAGLPCLDIRIAGTTVAGPAWRLIPMASADRPVANNGNRAAWAGSMFAGLVANPGGALPTIGLELRGINAAGTTVMETITGAAAPPAAGALPGNRIGVTGAFSVGTVARAEVGVVLSHAAATTYDYTIRLAGPQLEAGLAITSLILPPAGVSARSTRAPEILTRTGIEQRRRALLARITARGGQSIAYFREVAAALGYEVTVEEFRPFRFGAGRFGDPLCGEAWAFAWRVRAPETTAQAFRFGRSAFGEPLRAWGNAQLECVLTRIKPAHSVLLFAYGSA